MRDSVSAIPADDIEFELTLDGDAVDPMEMVRSDGYDPTNWKFLGPVVKGVRTEKFVHLNLDYCSNRDEAKKKAAKDGYELAEGQWRVPYRAKFGKPTRSAAAVFAGSKWRNPGGDRLVPFLDEFGEPWRSDFCRVDRDFYPYCRWVARKKK